MIHQTLNQMKAEPRSKLTYITEALRGTGGSGMKMGVKTREITESLELLDYQAPSSPPPGKTRGTFSYRGPMHWEHQAKLRIGVLNLK